jgi:squalene-hopene/tetraprenyl-beta-curcumene cyclase
MQIHTPILINKNLSSCFFLELFSYIFILMTPFKHSIEVSIDRLRSTLIKSYDEHGGHWCGKQWMSVSLTAEYLLLRKYLNLKDDHRVKMAIQELANNQNEDGGFSAYHDGPSDPSLSVICELALSLFIKKVDTGVASKAKNYIEKSVDLDKTLLIARFYRFLFQKQTLNGIPQVRPELILWPKWTIPSIYHIGSWVRSWLVPISILWHFEKYNSNRSDHNKIHFYIPFLRNSAIKKIKTWLLTRQESDGSWYGTFSSTMISMMALSKLGYTMEDAEMVEALDFIHSLQNTSVGTIRQQPFLGPVWDTAHSLIALNEIKEMPEISHFGKALEFLVNHQNKLSGDWSRKNKTLPGGWSFEYVNENYPDLDDTALVLNALKKYDYDKKYPIEVKRGLNWMISMQNKDGSWASFDKNNNGHIAQWYLNFRKYYIGNGPGLVLDKGTADLTAHVLETLASYGYSNDNNFVKKAIKWLKKHQEKDGSWFGRWGICYLYGTSTVLCALRAIGEEMEQAYIKNAVDFLKSCQNKDGGFGERPEAYFDPAWKGKGPSDPTQTAWVALALMAGDEYNTEALAASIEYLVKNLQPNGTYGIIRHHAVAAPPLYQSYELYPGYYPLMALQKYFFCLLKK